MSEYRYPAVNYETCGNLLAMFLAQAERFGERPFLWSKSEGGYAPWSWASVHDQVIALANAMIDQGLAPGDRVVLASENRPDWTIADLAILAAGAIPVPAYATHTEADHLHVLDNVEAAMAIVSTPLVAERFLRAAARAKRRPLVVMMDFDDAVVVPAGLTVLAWNAMMAEGEGRGVPAVVHRIQTDDLASIIHTSGTGGTPKGVMLAHRSILHNCHGAFKLLETIGLEEEVFLSFLPLCHSYEHTTGLFFPISLGAQVYFAEGAETLAANMVEAKPTIMTAVPRLYEMMRARILRAVEKEGGLKEKMFREAVDLGRRRMDDPASLGVKDKLTDAALDKLVRHAVKARFGGRLKAMISGGGPLNPDVGYFFRALGIPVLQGYGLTETAPVVSCNMPKKVKMNTVGPALYGVDIRIASDGEILVKGPLVMDGYWNDPESTRAVLDPDGWLHTGDVGTLDEDGFIQITDRKKDLIVNSGGHNISPQRVEGILGLEPEIGVGVVFGDRMPHLVALIVPEKEFLARWSKETGKPADLALVYEDADLRQAIGKAVERANAKLGTVEKIRKFALLPEPMSVENDQLTHSMKARRHVLRDRYGALIAGLYSGA
ncbi:AMP-dependent synthetase/ligase [Rhodospirillum rubrum]|uniref:AMP-dependent synthetase and ligase n=1 Tax=Rhodospirillum rubrum (strain ATCC 11170 / ATH 1.1.1 / DSM 467 / LMG 4362 / NCIMB 8255 / S1) TaxID=269796 RepID=Q2RSA4_RHORT|nr:AMP-dependent synthetase/ligase [Rhodospirillum rubrum]ABC22991.1 AMP-dependent synthetase and ligase [Rhodospirillum rubrum ATCC 11170]AEO48720.1 AMP-dependent synthetase and ligase [Rhodospirillum rubrum F11]MBK5954614.1 long-chain fatty acid--CoA ligase [Rhodospirillum rubrum]QXG78975.1 AMP-dependent synthetase/ligase [Rhodospirillum rubrum]HAP98767.1 long-chain fatty acid--CoA ligase [Rhodospirillum rubrum]